MKESEKSAAKRVLVFPFDLLSHYLRSIEFAQRFLNGYEVLFAQSGRYEVHVRSAGFRSFQTHHFPAAEVMRCAARFDFSWLNAENIQAQLHSMIAAIQEYKPALVVGDVAPALKMAAQLTGTKHVALVNGYMTKYYAGVRKLSQTHPGYPWVNKLPERSADALTALAESVAMRYVHRPFRRLRRDLKLPPAGGYLSELEGDLNLICDLPGLFPQKKLPENYRYIGPLMQRGTSDEADLLQQLESSKPTLCVTMGSSGSWPRMTILNDESFGLYHIVAAGAPQGIFTANHILERPFMNLDAVLPRCTLLICHGGNGTVYHGIRNHVFMLCETNHFEQEWNVHRLADLGLGQSINSLHPETLKQTIHRHMEDGAMPAHIKYRQLDDEFIQFEALKAVL